MVFISGDQMSGPDFVYLPTNVPPGQSMDISVDLVAPEIAGKYQGNWQLEAPSGKIFGVGDSADQPIWVRVRVITPSINTSTLTPTPSPVASLSGVVTPQSPISYDFVSNACTAQWENGHEFLPCPGQDGDKNGFVLLLSQAKLEDGTVMNAPTLLTFPEFTTGGTVQGIYPGYLVQSGDHLQTSASCENGARTCSALFQISYIDSLGRKTDLWTVGEFYDGMYSKADIDLSSLAGMRVEFVLSVSALGTPEDDRALWIAPAIMHLQAATPTATGIAATATPASPEPTATSSATPTSTAVPPHNPTPTPTAVAGKPAPQSSSISEIINQIISFFRKLLGH